MGSFFYPFALLSPHVLPLICLPLLLDDLVLLSSAYSHHYSVRRELTRASPEDAYQRCLKGWREDNLGLSLVPPPIILNQGDETTGVGFELMRIPPFGLREAITDCEVTTNGDWVMTYTIPNPGLLTWPVKEYVATVKFQAGSKEGPPTAIIWEADWTPLPLCGPIVNPLIRIILGTIIEYVAEMNE